VFILKDCLDWMLYYSIMKKFKRLILEIVIILPVAVIFLPLFYMAFLSMLFVVPPLLFGTYLFKDRKDNKPHSLKDVSLQFFSMMICLPLVFLMITAIMRSVILFVCSFFPAALFQLNVIHHDIIYRNFISVYGELFPYWLDFYWGIIGVVVLFSMAIMDSIRRSMLVRQIEILPTSKVHSAAIGLVELKGKAVPVSTGDNGPIILERMEAKGDGMYGSLTITERFYLDDGTGRVLIDPEGCSVGSIGNSFEINLHHALLKPYTAEKGLPESRLMPGDEVYVLGNLRIDKDDDEDSDNLGKVIIKPQKFIFDGFNFYDIFFVSNTSEEELLAACKKSITHGWKAVLLLMAIPGWLSINAWTNISQLKTFELEAAPAFFRLVSPPTALEREFSVKDLGIHPPIHWLDLLMEGHDKADDIMWVLKEQRLEKLAIPILLEQAVDIDHPAFSMANNWIRKLKGAPEGHWGHEYSRKELEDKYVKKNNSFVSRILLNYQDPKLLVSYRAYFGDVKSENLELLKRYVVFNFTNKKTGVVKHTDFFSKDGWNNVDDAQLFEYFLSGEYSLDVYAKRLYRGGRSDKGSRRYKDIDVKF
jgi:hypothetical protein